MDLIQDMPSTLAVVVISAGGLRGMFDLRGQEFGESPLMLKRTILRALNAHGYTSEMLRTAFVKEMVALGHSRFEADQRFRSALILLTGRAIDLGVVA